MPGKQGEGAKTREVTLCTGWSAESLNTEGVLTRARPYPDNFYLVVAQPADDTIEQRST